MSTDGIVLNETAKFIVKYLTTHKYVSMYTLVNVLEASKFNVRGEEDWGNEHLLFWPALSESFIKLMQNLIKNDIIKGTKCPEIVYVMDGCRMCALPEGVEWMPIVLDIGKNVKIDPEIRAELILADGCGLLNDKGCGHTNPRCKDSTECITRLQNQRKLEEEGEPIKKDDK